MKSPILAGIMVAAFSVSSVMAEDATPIRIPAVTVEQAAVIDQVAKDVKAAPDQAAEIVKKAILESKADSLLVAQIMRAAMLQAPGQVDAIYNAVIAAAPDAAGMAKMMLAAMLNGDEVAETGNGITKQMLAKLFRNTTDLSVDDFNKNTKVLVSREVIRQWTEATGGRNVEVKLDDFTYYISFGFGTGDNAESYQVVIIQRDSNTVPVI